MSVIAKQLHEDEISCILPFIQPGGGLSYGIIKTREDVCRGCYACVRACPVNAIEEQGGILVTDPLQCIFCGACLKACPQGARGVQGDIEIFQQLLQSGRKLVACLSSTFPAGIPGLSGEELVAILYQLGFSSVEEVAWGAKFVAQEYWKLLRSGGGIKSPIIGTTCNAVVRLVEKHYPELVPHLAPIQSPMVVTGLLVKELLGREVATVFLGPCVAKKEESLGTDAIDLVLTYREFYQFLQEKGINRPSDLVYPHARRKLGAARAISIPGGLLKTAGLEIDPLDPDILVVEGKENCLEVLESIKAGTISPLFVEALFCRGCIDGPGMVPVEEGDEVVPARKSKIIDLLHREHNGVEDGYLEKEVARRIDFKRVFSAKKVHRVQPTEKEIRHILQLTGKNSPEDQLNCGACGYSTCRERAIAVAQGKSELYMCVPFLRGKFAERYQQLPDKEAVEEEAFRAIVGTSAAIRKVKKTAARAATNSATVLILGESGTGKGLIAEAIHKASSRRDQPFIKVNCGAIPESLLESELFGYEEGAFTGAKRGGKMGKFELAHRGTIFLDEVGDMPLQMQVKLLQVLHERELERVGGLETLRIDTRVIAASNQDLRELVQEGRFRRDLFYRLNVITIEIPPLRERPEDIPLLVEYLTERIARSHNLPLKRISPEVLDIFCNYQWPGNVRELGNILERLLLLVEEPELQPRHLPEYMRQQDPVSSPLAGKKLRDIVAGAEREAILAALQKAGNNRTKAAQILGINRSSLYEKMKKHGLI